LVVEKVVETSECFLPADEPVMQCRKARCGERLERWEVLTQPRPDELVQLDGSGHVLQSMPRRELSDLGAMATELQTRVAELRARDAAKRWLCADITSRRKSMPCSRNFAEVGRLDVLVNNAGVIVTASDRDEPRRVGAMRRRDGARDLPLLPARVEIMTRQGTGGASSTSRRSAGSAGAPTSAPTRSRSSASSASRRRSLARWRTSASRSTRSAREPSRRT
jgi:hypothetical protein